ncbi:transposase [Rhodococcus sp. IITD102]|uniref:IS1634 family transposase n=1 Tax=Rhodococcus ruber TaxID=1830 RepID=UPI0026F41B73|nr:transposase [Rhodococcus ruber]
MPRPLERAPQCRAEADPPIWRDEHGRIVDAADDPGGRPGEEPETEAPETPEPLAGAVRHTGFRTHGKSKDHRDDLPQVVIGMAVTRTGIPVRVWSWPGNTADSALIRQVKSDMRDWNLSRVVWVADRGFTSAENRRYLQRAGGGYILGERLRSGSAEATAALSRQGRYRDVADGLRVKEVRLGDGDRFVIAHNPEAADRDAAIRTEVLARLREAIADTDRLPATKRASCAGCCPPSPD